MRKERIWELDFLRGIFILCVIIIHGIYDLRFFFQWEINTPYIYDFIQYNGGILFVLLSGICITLGTHFLIRGAIVMACGILISNITIVMYFMNMADESVIIYWGVLHLLGFCMLTYAIFKHLPTWALCLAAPCIIAIGYYLENYIAQDLWFCWLGLTPKGFVTADFFPVFPYLGWFLFGIVLGRTLYKNKKTLFPNVSSTALPIRIFAFCGRHSLWIYLLHQPILYGILLLFA